LQNGFFPEASILLGSVGQALLSDLFVSINLKLKVSQQLGMFFI
jgi:hypothetical protein